MSSNGKELLCLILKSLQIWGDDGDDIIHGGTGTDTFVVAIRKGSDTIVDFEVGKGLSGLAGGLSFGTVRISQQNNQTVIAADDETLAVLPGLSALVLGESSFTVV